MEIELSHLTKRSNKDEGRERRSNEGLRSIMCMFKLHIRSENMYCKHGSITMKK